MNGVQRQVVAEKIGSTVRVLELLGLQYSVSAPKNIRKKGNKSPRVVEVLEPPIRVYNSVSGHTWANKATGEPIPEVGSIEELFTYLSSILSRAKRRSVKARKRRAAR